MQLSFGAIREGTLSKGLSKIATQVGKSLANDHNIQQEFVTCVVRTFSKTAADWGTFDRIIDQELDQRLKAIVVNLGKDLDNFASAKEARVVNIENAKAAIATAEDKVKAAEEAHNTATAAATDAKGAAKTAAAMLKEQQKKIEKAGHILESEQHNLSTFKEGAMAAYTEVEAYAPPPPAPEEPAEETQAAQAPIDQAMEAAPAPAKRGSATILSSPGILLNRAAQAVGLSPRVAPN